MAEEWRARREQVHAAFRGQARGVEWNSLRPATPPAVPLGAQSSGGEGGEKSPTAAEQIRKLAALEQALLRKEKALRVLERRADAPRAAQTSESRRQHAAQLAVLRHEVAVLRRDCKIETASLATSGRRAERMRAHGADEAGLAAATALAAAADASVAAAEAEVAAEAAQRAAMHARAIRAVQAAEAQARATAGGLDSVLACDVIPGTHEDADVPAACATGGVAPSSRSQASASVRSVHRLPAAWIEWREVQKERQEHLKHNLRASWKAADTALDAMKQATPAKVDSKMSPRVEQRLIQAANERQIYLQSLSEEHRERAHQLHQTIERSSPAIEFRLDHGVEECRQEARALIRELREQRTREWARQTANLRRMRDETSPRVDDTFSQEILEKGLESSSVRLMMAMAPSQEISSQRPKSAGSRELPPWR
ncbi:hypothetical protein AB1Y20_015137 [Prymnesium parvum]|uniref:Centrosomal protein of 162 kDa n=1 Tax=Prymnesium parvum TaxID=97485 RepID=A0AB34JWY9_PRYPA|mmetsp:Transcript_1164/g.2819  ORF Transcript_1164/g.2819 Transcript_1164/m.2819 type:complete len:428 (+) Transcript_1164:42-1325(+)